MFIVTFQNPFSDYLGLCLLHCGPGIRIQRFATDIFTPSGLKRPLHLLWPQGNSLKGIDNKTNRSKAAEDLGKAFKIVSR